MIVVITSEPSTWRGLQMFMAVLMHYYLIIKGFEIRNTDMRAELIVVITVSRKHGEAKAEAVVLLNKANR